MDPVRFETEQRLISIEKKDILFLLEQSDGLVDTHTLGMVDELIPRCTATATPQGGYVWIDALGMESTGQLQIGKESFHVGKLIFRKIRRAESVVLFAATAGPGPENLSRELMSRGAYLEGYITDLIGTAIVEWTAEQLHQKIKSQAGLKGWKVTNRYSPGYCSWNVEEQQKLFRLLPSDLCGIMLSESSLMTPVKSVSGIIGTGTRVTFSADNCSVCPMKACAFRRTGR
jgi:hypothetical protein